MFKRLRGDRPKPDALAASHFTNRQLTGFLVATMLIVLLAPVGARAVPQLTQAVINDATGANKANVDASGNLQVKSSQSGTWSVGASQSGAWSVGVSNSSANPVPVSGSVGIDPSSNTVELGNQASSPGLVEDVGAPGRIAFEQTVDLAFTDGGNNIAGVVSVPVGKRLVIHYVSGGWVLPAGQRVLQVSIETVFGGHDAFHFFAPTLAGSTGGQDWLVLSQDTELFGDHNFGSGGDVVINARRSDTADAGPGAVTVSGYLLDCSGSVACQS